MTIENAIKLVFIMGGLARYIIAVIVTLLRDNITQITRRSGWALDNQQFHWLWVLK